MRAVIYEKPFSVVIGNVEKPKIEHPDDIIVKGTSGFI
jgi:glutathione-independent formaldehyde dehydrogenase